MINIEDKIYICNELVKLSEFILEKRKEDVGFTEQYKLFLKFTLISIDEARINCENDRYFSLRNVVDVIENNPEINRYVSEDKFSILYKIRKLQDSIDYILIDFVISTFHTNKQFTVLQNTFEEDIFIDNLKASPRFFEELVSYILNDCSFEGIELNEEYGYTTKRLRTEHRLTIIAAFACMMQLEKSSINPKEVLRRYI